jgi:hypothetical protein
MGNVFGNGEFYSTDHLDLYGRQRHIIPTCPVYNQGLGRPRGTIRIGSVPLGGIVEDFWPYGIRYPGIEKIFTASFF